MRRGLEEVRVMTQQSLLGYLPRYSTQQVVSQIKVPVVAEAIDWINTSHNFDLLFFGIKRKRF